MTAPQIAVLDYGIGNLRSAVKGLERAGADAVLTADAAVIAAADGVVLPGVGAFGPCIDALRDLGLDRCALDAVERGVPFLGICVGMQLLYEASDESPGAAGLGIVPGAVRRLPDGVKRPQMQWNRLHVIGTSPLLAGLDDDTWMYFVHSYAADDTGDTVATCEYGGHVVAAIERGRVWATQFHPEKSGDAGRTIVENFVQLVRDADGP